MSVIVSIKWNLSVFYILFHSDQTLCPSCSNNKGFINRYLFPVSSNAKVELSLCYSRCTLLCKTRVYQPLHFSIASNRPSFSSVRFWSLLLRNRLISYSRSSSLGRGGKSTMNILFFNGWQSGLMPGIEHLHKNGIFCGVIGAWVCLVIILRYLFMWTISLLLIVVWME